MSTTALTKEDYRFTDSKGRPVQFDGIRLNPGENAWLDSAWYLDGAGEAVEEQELDYLQDAYAEYLYQEAYEHAACAAYDYAKGRAQDGY